MSSAAVIPYPAQRRSGSTLLVRDKIDVCLWEASFGFPELCRLVIHDQIDTGSDIVALVLIYGPDSPWARWGLARRGHSIILWQCCDGTELGAFATMRAALVEVEGHVLQACAMATRH